MQEAWRETAHERFWTKLLNERCDMMIKASADKAPWLRSMRFDNAEVRSYQKRFGEILSARGTTMYKLIAGPGVRSGTTRTCDRQKKLACKSKEP